MKDNTSLFCSRWAGPDSILPADAGSAAASDKEATCSSGCSRCPAESRTATARTGNSAAKGERAFDSVVTVGEKYEQKYEERRASPFDWNSAGDGSGSSAGTAAAEGDLCSHHATPARDQDPVFHHRFHRSDAESHRWPTNPGVCALTRPLLHAVSIHQSEAFC